MVIFNYFILFSQYMVYGFYYFWTVLLIESLSISILGTVRSTSFDLLQAQRIIKTFLTQFAS